MTDLRGASDLRAFDRSFATSNRLRTEGVDHLLSAAREAGVKRLVAQSFCGWPYARTGGPVKSEEDPLDPDPPQEFRRTLDAIRYLEAAVVGADHLAGIVLRYGAFYGEGTGVFDGSMVGELRRRRVPLIGDAAGWWSFLHVDDAARATAIAVERTCTGIYNIVDDDPAPVSTWLPALARMLNAKRPFRRAGLARSLNGGRPCRYADDAGARRLERQSQKSARMAAGREFVARGLRGRCRAAAGLAGQADRRSAPATGRTTSDSPNATISGAVFAKL